ncbi:hypothetical protein [Chachezhania sediminis]|uniref:hypothetical protein n=1 Tax=Chachezhania sediminis TaxID=2599291 RepID=UPI00131AA904|nr:hypothetical protein [Chachezhania sediminis]
MVFVNELNGCTRGQIVLAQIARAIAEANTPELKEKLSAFLEQCRDMALASRLARTPDGALDIKKSLVAPIIFAEPRFWFFADKGTLERPHRLATVVEAPTFQFLTGTYGSAPSKLDPDDVANTTSQDFAGAQIGPTPAARQRAIFWATRFDDLSRIVPEVNGRGPLSPEKVKALRDHLGLSHLGGRDAVLLVFDANAAEDHNGEICRPYLFDGIDNPCFHLFARTAHPDGWNRALNLAHLDDPTVPAEGGPEIVLSSMAATRVERCLLLGKPPAASVDERSILAFMSNGALPGTASATVRQYMGW